MTINNPGNITIRDVKISDVSIFYEHQLDPEANHMAAFVRKNPHDRAAFDERWKQILSSTENINQTIFYGDEIVGHISCYPQEEEFEITYWIGKEYWGSGIATEALKKMLQKVSHRPLFARAAKDNLGSIRVLEKCGFKIIGEDKDYAEGRGEETEEYIFRLNG